MKFNENHHFSVWFPKVAGALVLFFAVFNINNQLNVLGVSSISDFPRLGSSSAKASIDEKDLAPIVGGKQVLKMEASSTGYRPNYFKVRAQTPVRWEITDTGTSGCTNAIVSKSLFAGQIDLRPGTTSVKEFTPTTPGRYKFSCWMGMVSGVIEVVDTKASASLGGVGSVRAAAPEEIPSGAKGCGCGGGGQGSCQQK